MGVVRHDFTVLAGGCVAHAQTELNPTSCPDRVPGGPQLVLGPPARQAKKSRRACTTAALNLEDTGLKKPVALISSWTRSEEHTSELQSRENLVCRLLLE